MTNKPRSLPESFDASLHSILHNLGHHVVLHSSVAKDLTPGQMFMLQNIARHNPCSVTRLSDLLEVKPSAITVMLDRLEKHDLVVRTRDKADRRLVLIELTDKGKHIIEKGIQIHNQVLERCMSQIDAQELDAFLGTLQKIAKIAEETDVTSLVQEIEEASSDEKP